MGMKTNALAITHGADKEGNEGLGGRCASSIPSMPFYSFPPFI
jgi:hypothetical protein